MIATAHAPSDRTAADDRHDERREQLRDRCMKELSRLDRLIIVLHYYEKLTLREVAAVLQLPEDQVETRRQTLAHRLSTIAG